MRTLRWATGLLAAVAVAGPAPAGGGGSGDPENPYPGYQSALYGDPASWLCRPDQDDPCDHDLDYTVVKANGRARAKPFRPARDPKFDCFYVYPTISTDPGGNSDLVPGENQEILVVRTQAARLSEVCRVFAPMYRQVTLTALAASLAGNPIPTDPALADADLLDAWKHYVANDNGGRGVLLIGHSQGASRLTRLIAEEIDPNPVLRERLVSAMLLGTSFQVPDGADVGAHLQNIPLCRSRRDVGCVITYSSFRSTAPPPPTSFFGRSLQEGWKAGCTNPADLAGGRGWLVPYFGAGGTAWVDPALGVEIETPFVTLPRFVEAECVEHEGFVVLSLVVHGDPADPRVDDIGGDLTPEWGMHLVDVNVAMGSLVEIAKSQGRAHRRRR